MDTNYERDVSTAVLTTFPVSTGIDFEILLSKIAKIHDCDKLKLYRKAPSPTQLFSATEYY